jgi:hypothetical protein
LLVPVWELVPDWELVPVWDDESDWDGESDTLETLALLAAVKIAADWKVLQAEMGAGVGL